MRTSRARTNAFEESRVLLVEARALLQDIEERMDEAWRVFHEELKAMTSLPKEDQEEELVEDPRYPDYEEPVPHPALEPMPYEEPVPHPALEPMPYEEPVPHPALEPMPYEEPVPPALVGHVSEHMFDHMPYEDEEPMPYEEPVPHTIVWGYDSEDDSDEEVDNEVELLNDDELLDIVW
jgi:hypothetical protein